ncbi:hypothetical protein BGZ76_005495 [Entomortierella beljakovae]|nr:hypothetical protein BGZ76_005495 [Entomortierella beljakovae]
MRSRNLTHASADASHEQDKYMDNSTQQHKQTLEENDPDNVFITSGPSAKRQPQQKRSTAIDTTSNLIAPQLQECLLQAAQHAQDLQDRSHDLETENKKLKEIVRQHRTSALDWCSVAKQYQQDRNYMALRLAELELELQLLLPTNDTKQNHNNVSESSSKPTAGTSTRQNGGDSDTSSLSTFISQSISEILDYMSPANGSKEPMLPPLSKGSYTTGKVSTNTGKATTEPVLRSALKSSSKSTSCNCGCQEEIRAWKTRCDFAENQATLHELRCEKTNIVMDAYKAKWTQWKETVVREQYQRRMKAAISPQSARFMSFNSKSSQQVQSQQEQSQQELGHKDFHKRSSADELNKRTRFKSEESNSSQKRQEITKRNTLLNQLMSVAPESVDTSNPSTSKGKDIHEEEGGVGSADELHVAFERKSDVLDSNNILTLTPERRKSITSVPDSEGNDTSVEYIEQPMSLTFPSDLALYRRGQGFYELEDDGDNSSNDGDNDQNRPEGGVSGTKLSSKAQGSSSKQYMDHSPTVRVSERNQRRVKGITHNGVNNERVSSASDRERAGEMSTALMSSIASDRSSPPMFDSEDYAAPFHSEIGAKHDLEDVPLQKNHPVTPNQGSKNAYYDESLVNSSDIEHSFVPETPLDQQQGLARMKDSQRWDHSPDTSIYVNSSRNASTQQIVSPNFVNGNYTVDTRTHIEIFSQSPIPSDDPDKENKAPQDQPQDQLHSERSSSDIDINERDIEDNDVNNGNGNESGHTQGQQKPIEQQKQPPMDGQEQRIYNFTERRKDKRKQMHGHDCACCRRFYEITGPLPRPDGYNAFFTPAPRPGEKETWEKSADERLQDRIQQISRHRVQHEQPLTPPGFWDTDFPSTQDRLEWDKVAQERRDRKKQKLEAQQRQQQQQQRHR